MATQTDILNALAQIVTDAVSSVPSSAKRSVFLGWPSRKQLLDHMQSGQTDITVYPPPQLEKNVTVYFPVPYLLSQPSVNLFIGSSGNKVQTK